MKSDVQAISIFLSSSVDRSLSGVLGLVEYPLGFRYINNQLRL
jgi:hypothetical protein